VSGTLPYGIRLLCQFDTIFNMVPCVCSVMNHIFFEANSMSLNKPEPRILRVKTHLPSYFLNFGLLHTVFKLRTVN
jgi:hypothetical protein